ncbi:MAG: RNA polymerase sigma factor [Ginsengibacter sp.]
MEKTQTILAGCLEGNRKYQKILYEKYHLFSLKIVFRYIYNYEEAIEVSNDGMVKVFHSIQNFVCDGNSNLDKHLSGWIKRIMINTSIDLLRKKMMLPEIGGIAESAWNLSDKTPSAEQKIIYKELIMLIKNLPPEYRIVFNMHVIDGYKHIEIAEILGIPIGTSKSHLMRAKLMMQKIIIQKESLAACNS